MDKTFTFTLRDLNTGAGRTGLTCKYRSKTDNFTADVAITITEISGRPGAYQSQHPPTGVYKVFANNSEEPSFGGQFGRPLIDPDSLLIKVGSDVDVDGKKLKNGGGTINSDYDYIYLAFLSANFYDKGVIDNLVDTLNDNIESGIADAVAILNTAIAGLISVTPNTLIVDAALPANITGKQYQTIQAAINYAQTQTPAVNNSWNITIRPNKNRDTGYSENITLQPYVHLTGSGIVRVTGSMSGASLNTTLQNIFWNYAGNFGLANVKGLNSIFRCFQAIPNGGFELTATGCRLTSCGLISFSGSTPKVTSGGSNVFMGSCFTNCDWAPGSGDKGTAVQAVSDATVDFEY